MHRLTSTAAPPVEADPYAEGYAAGRLAERAAVVAWVRAAAAGAPSVCQREAGALVVAADTIERGQHRGGITPAAGVISDPAQIRAYYRGASDALQAVLQHRAGGAR